MLERCQTPYKRFLPRRFETADTLQILGSGRQAGLHHDFGVLVWNIYKSRRSAWQNDFVTLAQDKDLILLQEAVLKTPFDTLFSTPDQMEWVMARSYAHQKTLRETGVKTGCSTSSNFRAFLTSDNLEPVFQTPKMLLATRYPIEGAEDTLLVVNVHALNFVSLSKYASQLNQIRSMIEHTRGPVLLAGDFNTWNRRRYGELLGMAGGLGLAELKLDRRPRIEHMFKNLDHVFYRGMEPLEASFIKVRSSDHDPICARFRFTNSSMVSVTPNLPAANT